MVTACLLESDAFTPTIFRQPRMLIQRLDFCRSRPASYEEDNYVLDEQVVRATLKSCNLLASALDRPLGSHSNYLQLLRTPDQSNRPVISATMWQDYATIIYLLEWRLR